MAIPGGRPTFLNLPTGKVRDERRLVQAVNGALDGKLNAVGDFTIDEANVSSIIQDPRVSRWSYINLMPLDPIAAQADYYIQPGDRQFSATVFYRGAQFGQMGKTTPWTQTIDTNWATIADYDFGDSSAGVANSLLNGTIQLVYAGVYQVAAMLAWNGRNNVTYEIGVSLNGADPTNPISFTNTGQDAFISIPINVTSPVSSADILRLQIRRTAGTETGDLTSATFGVSSVVVTEPTPIPSAMSFRYVVVG